MREGQRAYLASLGLAWLVVADPRKPEIHALWDRALACALDLARAGCAVGAHAGAVDTPGRQTSLLAAGRAAADATAALTSSRTQIACGREPAAAAAAAVDLDTRSSSRARASGLQRTLLRLPRGASRRLSPGARRRSSADNAAAALAAFHDRLAAPPRAVTAMPSKSTGEWALVDAMWAAAAGRSLDDTRVATKIRFPKRVMPPPRPALEAAVRDWVAQQRALAVLGELDAARAARLCVAAASLARKASGEVATQLRRAAAAAERRHDEAAGPAGAGEEAWAAHIGKLLAVRRASNCAAPLPMRGDYAALCAWLDTAYEAPYHLRPLQAAQLRVVGVSAQHES